jgi:hypothetical protein
MFLRAGCFYPLRDGLQIENNSKGTTQKVVFDQVNFILFVFNVFGVANLQK